MFHRFKSAWVELFEAAASDTHNHMYRAFAKAMPVANLTHHRNASRREKFDGLHLRIAHRRIQKKIDQTEAKGTIAAIRDQLMGFDERLKKLSPAERRQIQDAVMEKFVDSNDPLQLQAREMYIQLHPELATPDVLKQWIRSERMVDINTRIANPSATPSSFITQRELHELIDEERRITKADPNGIGRY